MLQGMLLAEDLFRISVARYHQMIASGIFREDDDVELLNGYVVTKMPKNRAHSLVNRLVSQALAKLFGNNYYVDAQEPITLANSEPEPDVFVVRGQPRDYPNDHPTAADIALLVEVSDATLRRDQGAKKMIYADAGIPVYWVINIPQRQIEVYTQPTGFIYAPTYQHCDVYLTTDLVPVVIDGVEVARFNVDTLLP